jgi:hypothetical protein
LGEFVSVLVKRDRRLDGNRGEDMRGSGADMMMMDEKALLDASVKTGSKVNKLKKRCRHKRKCPVMWLLPVPGHNASWVDPLPSRSKYLCRITQKIERSPNVSRLVAEKPATAIG